MKNKSTNTKSPLVFPPGEFTWLELATANGTDKPGSWQRFDVAKKTGVLVFAGERVKTDGKKGKPEKLWKLADGVPIPMIVAVPNIVAPTVAPVEVELVADKPKKEPKGEVVVPVVNESVSSVVQPAVAPPVVVVVDEVIPPVVPATIDSTVNPAAIVGDITPIEDKCPYCTTPLVMARTVAGGVKVWCSVNDHKICSCSENPYGYSNNVVNAVKILHDKFCRVPNAA